jgi:hypothetical protein
MGWTKVSTNKYATELSDIEAYQLAEQGKQIRCPKCREYMPRVAIGITHAIKDREGDITHFVIDHPCGATLTVFND